MAAYDAREAAERGIPPATTPPFVANYDQGRRTLELKFSAPFDRFRTVIIRLAPGITAFDSQPLAPYELAFHDWRLTARHGVRQAARRTGPAVAA